MQRKSTFIYRSTMREYSDFMDYVKREVGAEYEFTIYMLWQAFNVGLLLNSCYFELLRVGDSKYTLTIQKYLNDNYKIILEIR